VDELLAQPCLLNEFGVGRLTLIGRPNMSDKSTSTTRTAGHQLEDDLQKVRSVSFTHKKINGFFISKGALERMEKVIDSLMEDPNKTTVPISRLIELNDEVNGLRQKLTQTVQQLQASEASSAILSKDLAKAKEASIAQNLKSDARIAAINKEKLPLQQEVKDLRTAIDAAKRNSKSTPEDAELLVKTVKDTQNQLQALNSEHKAEIASKRLLNDQVKALESELTLAKERNQRLERMSMEGSSFSDIAVAGNPGGSDIPLRVMEPIPEVDSAVLRRVFDDKVMKAISQVAESKRVSIREQAFALMQLAQKRDPTNFVGYADYARALFKKVAETKTAKRTIFSPLLNDLFLSMVGKDGKRFNTLKTEYRKVFSPTEEETIKVNKKVEEKTSSFWEDAKHDFWILKRKTVSKFRKLKSRLLSPFSGVKSVMISLWSLFSK